MNTVNLIGRLTRDPECSKTTTGTSTASFTLAVDGRNDSTSFIPVIAYGTPADVIAKYVHKGNLLGVTGRLNQRTFEKSDGDKKFVVEVVCDNITLLEKKPTEEANEKPKKSKKN